MVIGQISFERVEGCSLLYKSKYNNDGILVKHTDEERFKMILPKKIETIKD